MQQGTAALSVGYGRVSQVQNRIVAGHELHPRGYRIKKAIGPELGIHALSVSFSLGDQYTEGRQVLIFTAQAITEPGAHAGAVALLGPGLEKGNGRVMVNGIGMQGADNADVVHYLRRMGEQVADPCPGLSEIGREPV